MPDHGAVRDVTSDQTSISEDLAELTVKYKTQAFRRPIAEHTRQVFEQHYEWLTEDQTPLILDSCCGVGQSTAILAERYPESKVLGIDKSAARLSKHHAYECEKDNYRIVRADVIDFWRLVHEHNILFTQHYLLYPNPYPKLSQITKRWHAGPLMPTVMKISQHIHVRSNWKLYLQEFQWVAQTYGYVGGISVLPKSEPMTAFERKYMMSGQDCYALILNMNSR